MAYVPRKIPSTNVQVVTATMGNIIGVDFRREECESFRTPDSVGRYRSITGQWETHAGYTKYGVVPTNDGADPIVYGVYKYHYYVAGTAQTKVLIHTGQRLFIWDNYPAYFTSANLTCIWGSGAAKMPEQIMQFRTFNVGQNSRLLILGGGTFLIYDGTTCKSIEDGAFTPTTYTAKTPDGAGTALQQRNMINPAFIEEFIGDGTSDEYFLAVQDLDATEVTITVDGVAKTENTHFTVDRTAGKITFSEGNIPAAPSVTSQPNVIITAYKTTAGYFDMVKNCNEILVFDNRVILADGDYPNRIIWCGLNEPTYFGEIMYNDRAGSGTAPIKSLQLLASKDAFLAIKSADAQNGSYAVMNTVETDENYNPKNYVATEASGTIGCMRGVSSKVFIDDNVFISPNGLSAISRELNVSSERNIEHRSTTADPRLLLEDLDNIVIEQYDRRLYVLCTATGHMYIADGNLRSSGLSNYVEYEWAYLEDQGIWENQYEAYVDENDVILNPANEDGTEGGTRTGGTASGEYIGGTFRPAYNICNLGEKELYLCCYGALMKYNFDMLRSDSASELTSAAYRYDNRRISDYNDTSFTFFGYPSYFKRLINERNDLLLNTREYASVNVMTRNEKTTFENSRVLNLASSTGFRYAEYNYADYAYGGIEQVSYVLRKLKSKIFRRLQVRIQTAKFSRCTAFESITLQAEILENNLK